MAKRVEMFFWDFVTSDDVVKRIDSLRQRYNIPRDGFADFSLNEIDKRLFPTEWKYAKDKKVNRAIANEINSLLGKLPLYLETLFALEMWVYIFYGEVDPRFFYEYVNAESFVTIEDSRQEFDSLLKGENVADLSESKAKELLGRVVDRSKKYPVSIFLSAYTSQTMLIQFLKEYQGWIKKTNARYTDANSYFSKTKYKQQAERDREIVKFHHRGVKARRIADYSNQKYGVPKIDAEDVRTIVSKEKKRKKWKFL